MFFENLCTVYLKIVAKGNIYLCIFYGTRDLFSLHLDETVLITVQGDEK